jgi:putative transposase
VTAALTYLVPLVGVAAAYAALGVPRSSFYRARKPRPAKKPRPSPKRRLSDAERAHVLDVLNSDRFADKTPRQVYAEALDENEYLCSVRTMYRILDENDLVRERRDQRRHPAYSKPQLTAHAPNQVWSWDITKVPGPERGIYYSLYVMLDLYSRFIVGWVISAAESKEVAKSFIAEAFHAQNAPRELKCHSDRGTPMVARSTALLYADLGITASYSRPRVSDDNPFSEAAFKTFKYRPEMRERFGSLTDARAFFSKLFDWYNNRHYHTGISLLTPADVHRGRANLIIAARQTTLDAAYRRFPERFSRRPLHPPVPEATWINPPSTALS